MSAPAGPAPPPAPPSPAIGMVDIASRAIVQVGFPVFVAGVLLWWMLTRFDAAITRLDHNAEVLDGFVREMQAQTIEIKAQTQALAAIARDSKTLVHIHEKELQQKGQVP